MDDSTYLTLESSTTSSTFHRRNSIATSVVVPKKLTLPPTRSRRSSFHDPSKSLLDLELLSLKSSFVSYTSLKDVLPSSNAAISLPTASSSSIHSGYELSIRNRLVKQSTWAYLQPKSVSSNSSFGPDFICRFGHRDLLTPCLSFIHNQLLPGIIRIFHRILRAIRGLVSS